jgi:hypothetical protein
MKMGSGLRTRLVMHSANKASNQTSAHHPTNTTILKINYITPLVQNSMLRKIFGPKREKLGATGEKCMMRSFMICTTQWI